MISEATTQQHSTSLIHIPLKVFFNTLIGPIRRSRKHKVIQYVFSDVFTDDRNLLTLIILLIFLILVIELPIGALVGLQPIACFVGESSSTSSLRMRDSMVSK